MAGVALSAATWGVVLPIRAAAVAVVAVAATTVVLSFVNFEEKPAGIRLIEAPARESIWRMPRGVGTERPAGAGARDAARPGARDAGRRPIALTRDALVRPFIYAGWPDLVHRLVYADRLAEATGDGSRLGGAPGRRRLRGRLAARAALAAVGRLPSGSRRQLPIAVRCRGCLRASRSSCRCSTSSRPSRRRSTTRSPPSFPSSPPARDRRRRLDRRDPRAARLEGVARRGDARRARPEPREGRGAPHGPPARDRRRGRRSSTPTSSTARPTSGRCSSRF